MSFRKCKNAIYLTPVQIPLELLKSVPGAWAHNREDRDGPEYHATVAIDIDFDALNTVFPVPSVSIPYYVLGIVQTPSVVYAPIVCPQANKFCLNNKLPHNYLHVTLGFMKHDDHDRVKSYLDLHDTRHVDWNCVDRMALDDAGDRQCYAHFVALGGQGLWLHKRHVQHSRSSDQMIAALHTMYDAGHCAPALLGLCKLNQPLTVPIDRVPLICETSAQAIKLAEFLNNMQMTPHPLFIASGNTITPFTRPKNMTCIMPGLGLWGSGKLGGRDADTLAALGITMVVNLMETCKTSLQAAVSHYLHVPIDDQCPPQRHLLDSTLDTIHDHLDNGHDAQAVIHCLGGHGRTAVFLMAYLIRFKHMDLTAARATLDNSGRRTILSPSQIDFLLEFEQNPFADASHNFKADTIIMCGLPGSGKSTLAKHIAKHAREITRISQDEMGRKGCEAAMAKNWTILLVDRCNLSASDRAEWRPARAHRTLCVFMDIPACEAAYRVEHRTNHESLSGKGGAVICKKLIDQLTPPNAKAEKFTEVIRLINEADVARQVAAWGLPPLIAPKLTQPFIHKFPRTQHLYNLGAASREDLIMTRPQDLLNHGPVFVEEKIDGANLGLSIDVNTFTVRAQNRSHYVNRDYHAQFTKLDSWISTHTADLFAVLDPPGRYILFGEWMAIRHSIHYTRLPSLFVAFDMFDTQTGRFWSRTKLETILKPTSIPMVPILAHRVFSNGLEVAALVGSASQFYDGLVEGVYVRREEGDWTIQRAKIVRKDFMTGMTDHWAEKGCVPNVVC